MKFSIRGIKIQGAGAIVADRGEEEEGNVNINLWAMIRVVAGSFTISMPFLPNQSAVCLRLMRVDEWMMKAQ
uniref:Uncharacterized protein n=1 Tax=Oryza sativa subsp. japonica TaxID=39947 RepID=Q6ETB4_ORYSJ|nr:hypothetical protein [Oryza sativa Japonica Group]